MSSYLCKFKGRYHKVIFVNSSLNFENKFFCEAFKGNGTLFVIMNDIDEVIVCDIFFHDYSTFS